MIKIMKKNLSWDDVTILDFIHIKDIVKTDELTELEKQIELVKILAHDDRLDDLPVAEFNKYMPLLNILLTDVPHKPMKKSYEFLGRKFNACNKIEKITTGQYIDYSNICKTNPGLNEMSRIIGYLLIPENGRYNVGYDMDELCAAIEREMPITEAYGFIDFFIDAQMTLFHHLRDYLIKAVLKTPAPMKTKIQMVSSLIMVGRKLKRAWHNMV
jgi:hypothetical protein